mgnify:CR=1 FL=1
MIKIRPCCREVNDFSHDEICVVPNDSTLHVASKNFAHDFYDDSFSNIMVLTDWLVSSVRSNNPSMMPWRSSDGRFCESFYLATVFSIWNLNEIMADVSAGSSSKSSGRSNFQGNGLGFSKKAVSCFKISICSLNDSTSSIFP